MRTVIIRKSDIKKDFPIIIVLCGIGILPYMTIDVISPNPFCIASFLVNGIIAIVGIVTSKRKYSISMIIVYWIFMFFFMYLAPLIQYLNSVFPWRGTLSNNEVIITNCVILLFNVSFLAGRALEKNVRVIGAPKIGLMELLCGDMEFSLKSRYIITSIVLAFAMYSISQTGISGIIVSRAQATQVFYSGENSAVELIVESVIPAFIAYSVAEAAQCVSKKKESPIRFLLLLLAMIVCFFPTSLPRYKAITIYGVVFLILIPKIKKGDRFLWLFILALFFMFPLLNSFRHMISMETFQDVFKDGFLSVYVNADYDTYRMLASSIEYVIENGCEWGYQLLGAILFFVPRAIWPTKPGGSGALLIRAELGNEVPTNVSCPFIGEGILNFGIVGVLIFGIALGITISKIDDLYWEKNGDKLYIALSPYLFIIFMLFFILRGDLLSGYAYLCGFLITGFGLKEMTKFL